MLHSLRTNILVLLLSVTFAMAYGAERHVQLAGLSLGLSADGLIGQLVEKGFRQSDSVSLTGRVAGLDVLLSVGTLKGSSTINHVLMTTQYRQGSSQYEDYSALLNWLKKQYGWPDWQASVRSHRFARWFVGFNRDIVLIGKASQACEVWFYEDHQKRDFDYYAILKYCESHPVKGVPHFTARECVVWNGDAPVASNKHKVDKRRGRHAVRSRHAARRGKSKARRRRR